MDTLTDLIIENDILIVDDTEANLKLMADILQDVGYNIRTASNGNLALQSAKIKPPALILLDVKMPEIDGFEVCSRLKAEKETCAIPIIFISAFGDEISKIKGFEVGGIDFIYKPFHKQELLVRIKAQYELRLIQLNLEDKNTKLEKEIAERKRVEEEIQKHKKLYEDLINTQPAGIYRFKICTTNEVGKETRLPLQNPLDAIELVSDKFCELLNIKRNDFTGNPQIVVDLVHPEDKAEFIEKNTKAIKTITKFTWEGRMIIESGIKCMHFESVPRQISPEEVIWTGILYDITERKQAEEKLHITKTVVENSSTVLFRWKAAEGWPVEYVSENVLSQFGFTSDELQSGIVPYIEMIHPDDRVRVGEEVALYSAKGDNSFRQEYRIITKDGSVRWVEDRSIIGRDIDGKILYYEGIILDQTERKKAEHDANERYKELGAFYRLSELTERKGISIEELYQEFTEKLPNSWQYPEISYARIVIDEKEFKTLNFLENCQWVQKSDIHINGKVAGSIEIGYLEKRPNEDEGPFLKEERMLIDSLAERLGDITERKLTEETLIQTNYLLSSFISYSPIYAFIKEVTPSESRVLMASENFHEMIGIPGSKMIGKNMYELFPTEFAAKISTDDWDVASKGQLINIDEELNGKYYTTFKYPIKIGKKVLLAGYTIDLTERKKTEEKLVQLNSKLEELVATKDRFFSIIAHDLRSPFNSILGYSEVLIKNIQEYDKNKIEKQVKYIYLSAIQVFDLLQNLLTWAQTQRGKIEFNPNMLDLKHIALDNVKFVEQMATKKNIQIAVEIDENLLVFADTKMINTILRNLLINAIKYTRQHGKITVFSKTYTDYTEIAIADTGVGMPEETRQKLFNIDSHITTKGTENEKGTGLGLVICKEFIEIHGGKIWVESKLNEGSIFSFTIPNKKTSSI
jgi:PAS domain S-box-containing protein